MNTTRTLRLVEAGRLEEPEPAPAVEAAELPPGPIDHTRLASTEAYWARVQQLRAARARLSSTG
jgi:hypothetical protein